MLTKISVKTSYFYEKKFKKIIFKPTFHRFVTILPARCNDFTDEAQRNFQSFFKA